MQRHEDGWSDGEQTEVIREGTTQLYTGQMRSTEAEPHGPFTQADTDQPLRRVSRRRKRDQASP